MLKNEAPGGSLSQQSLPPGLPPASQWYLVLDQDVIGPVSSATVQGLLSKRSIGPSTLICRTGDQSWRRLEEISDFRASGQLRRNETAEDPLFWEGARFAGFWIRCLAYLIDYGLILTLFTLFGRAVFTITVMFTMGLVQGGLTNLFSPDLFGLAFLFMFGTLWLPAAVLSTIVAFWYAMYFGAGPWQATPGKRLCGIYVARERQPFAVTRWLAVARVLSYWLSSLTLGVGFMMAGWTREKRALHDMICRTRVIYGRL